MPRANVCSERIARRRRISAATGWRDADYLSMRALLSDLRECRAWARGRLLDIGCGNQPYRELFAPFIREYVG